MDKAETARRLDVLFHFTLCGFLLFASSLGLVNPDLVELTGFGSSVLDLVLLSLLRFIFDTKPCLIASIFYTEFKLVLKLLLSDEFMVDDFVFIALISFAVSLGRVFFRPQCDSPESGNPPISWTRLFRFAKGQWRRLIVGMVVLLIRLPFSIAVPHYVSEGIGALIERDSNRFQTACIGVFVAGTVDAMLDYWCVYIFATAKEEITFALRSILFKSILLHPLKFFDVTAVGELQSRLNADTAEMANDLSWVFRFAIEAVVRITGVLGYMIIFSWRLALLVTFLVPLNSVANTYLGEWMGENSKRSQDLLAASNTVANECFGAVQTVKSFHGEDHAIARYMQSLGEYKKLQYKAALVTSTYYMLVSTFLMNTVMQTAIVAYGGFLTWHGLVQTERLVSFFLYIGQLQNYTSQLFNTYVNLVKCASISDKIFSLINASDLEDCNNDVHPQQLILADTAPHVEFKNVSMRYLNRPEIVVLRNVSFTIRAGSCTGIVGHSGSGKSSLLSLLLRLYEPEAGEITINSVPIHLLPLKTLRGRVLSIVSQEPVLFRGTLRDNILYSFSQEQLSALPLATVDQLIERAMAIACISDFVRQLPRGLETQIGDRGVTLSGGQKQRIAIARAVVCNPPVLLLDEAMSALDPESEDAVQKALQSAMRSRTTLMVSHRISTVIDSADHCVVIHKGEVVEQGAPRDLLAKPQSRSEVSLKLLYELQQKYIE